MKKNLLTLLLIAILGISFLSAQSNLQGINYQGVARDASGNLLTNSTLIFKMPMVSKNDDGLNQTHFSEVHTVTTDNLGLFQFVIGSGQTEAGILENIPWADRSIYLQTEMANGSNRAFEFVNLTELLAVPYAFYARTAEELILDTPIDLPTEKNQSIYWTTGGNTGTKPPTQFLGTLDNKPLVFKTNNTISMTLTTNGRLEIANRTPAGPDNLKTSYPMVVEGTLNNQGIWIEINGSRSGANNFLTFEDANGIQGRVEGETTSELESSEIYIYTTAVFVLNGVALAANIVALGFETADAWAKIWTFAKGVPLLAKTITYTIQAASLLTASIKWSERIHKNIGVVYKSGNGDYAEWLKRKPGERDLQFGEIVGVEAGQVSLNTQGSKQMMVVSQDPIVLGNTPSSLDNEQFEKIAFIGQLPVKVVGTVKIGDYILPSGNNDGFGVAISPAKMKAGDYDRIVGVAWEATENGLFNYVNVAVGINSNDLSGKVDDLSHRIDNIMAYLDGQNGSKFNAIPNTSVKAKPSTSFDKVMSDEAFDQYVDQNQAIIHQIFSLSRSTMVAQGYDEETLKQYDKVFSDPVKAIKTIRRDPNYLTHWSIIDNKIQSRK